MAATPPVLDLAGRIRAGSVDVVATPVTELLVALQTFGFQEARPTLEVGQEWFDRIVASAGPDVLAAVERLRGLAWGSLLAAALVERWAGAVGPFLDRIEAMEEGDLWLLLASRHVRPFADRVDPEVFTRALHGDRAARGHLAEAERKLFGEAEPGSPVWDLEPDELRDLVVTAVRGWHRDVLGPQEPEVVRVLERDAGARGRLRRTLADEALVEAVTNGLVYVPEPWVRRTVLTPHLAMRPWNVVCAYEDAWVICYPVSDESLGTDPAAPPARLLRLHKALADERRLRILRLLMRSDMNLQELSDAVGLAKSTTHHHTVVLRSAGLIRSSTEPENRYSLRREAIEEAGSALRDFLEGPGR